MTTISNDPPQVAWPEKGRAVDADDNAGGGHQADQEPHDHHRSR
jgi:hypothetical protein